MIGSLLVGLWTHLLLDSFTHTEVWMVVHWTLLFYPLGTVDHHAIRVCHLLWYGCSYVGVAWLVLSFRDWEEGQGIATTGRSRRSRILEALTVGLLVLPIELLHHLVRSSLELVLVALLTLGVVLIVILGIGVSGNGRSKRPETDASPPP